MNPWSLTKKQLIFVSAITVYQFVRIMVDTNFLTADLSNRQYLIFGVLTLFGFVNLILAVVFYQAKKQKAVSV
jgi:hypothetical protein